MEVQENQDNQVQNPNDQTPKGWMDLLRRYISTAPKKSQKQQEEETTKLFLDILKEDKMEKEKNKPAIPRFFFKKPTNFSDIYLSVKAEAKQKFLILKSYDLPQRKNLKDLWTCLKDNKSPPNDSTERINYKDFQLVGEKNPMFSEYFPFYDEINEEIKEYYLLVAQRKFFFFLDPKRTGKIYINDIVTSNILTEFLEMSESNHSPSELANNWFSLQNFWNIYRKYVELDKDKNGMLSKEELIKYGPGLTPIFIDRIFEEYQKYENAIDFKQFIDFVLAMENRKDPASIQFIWRAIDVYHKNAVDTFVINMFYRAVIKKLYNRDRGEYRIDDIKDEIWDMIGPKNPNYITLEDVLKSSYRDQVLSLLIDAKAFYQHDQKEQPFIEEFTEIDGEDYN